MWPFRKKPKPAALDEEIVRSRAKFEAYLASLDKQAAQVASAPLPRIVWTPLISAYGQVVALAWKNDTDTALRLLEEPAMGRA